MSRRHVKRRPTMYATTDRPELTYPNPRRLDLTTAALSEGEKLDDRMDRQRSRASTSRFSRTRDSCAISCDPGPLQRFCFPWKRVNTPLKLAHQIFLQSDRGIDKDLILYLSHSER